MKTALSFAGHFRRFILFLIMTGAVPGLVGSAAAGPGAHGPGGEHLDTPGHATGSEINPRLETSTELFELVATLRHDELSIMIDRYETNEPVLGESVAVNAGGIAAEAQFHADLGDYAVDDPAFVRALWKPGEHALVFTVISDDETDLLDGTLAVRTASRDGGDDHAHVPVTVWAGAGAGLLGVGAAGFWVWRRVRLRPLAVATGDRS
jgi:hypothetical protein